MNQPGVLVYKCRRCGYLDKSRHAPDMLMILLDVLNGTMARHNSFIWKIIESHICADGECGVTDLIGTELDKGE